MIGCCCFVLFFIPGAICLLTSLLFYNHFDMLFGEMVRKQMIISDDTLWWYKRWLQIPATETLRVHFFELENLADIQKNWSDTIFFDNSKQINQSQVLKMKKQIQIKTKQFVKPRFREVGPFVFSIKRNKNEISFNGENKEKITYLERIQYHFDSLLSYENLHYKIVVVNSELSVSN